VPEPIPFPEDDERRRRDPLTERFGGAAPPARAMAPPPPAAPPPAAPATNVGTGANGPSPTGFTNFARVQSANRDVSQREAASYGRRAEAKADSAKQSLDALNARFGGAVNAGTVGAPQNGFAAQPPDGAGLVGESTRPTLGGGLTSSQMFENADKTYSGPGGLGDIEGVDDAYSAKLGAEQNLDALGTEAGVSALVQQQNAFNGEGNNELSGALIGGAGRADFDALRARFNPDADFAKAETAAADRAKSAKAESTRNAEGWRALGDKTKGTEDATAAAEAAKAEGKAAAEAKVKLDKRIADDFAATVKDAGTLGAKSVFEHLDPLNYIGGGKRNTVMDSIGSTFGEDFRGNISWQDSPLDRDVFSQMDDVQWAELSGLTGPAQRNWINTRAAQLKNGTGRKRGTYKGRD